MDDRELRSWIETTTGRTVRDVERMGYGASRATFIVAMAEGGDLVARVDTGDGPMAATELSLGREAEVYRALAGTRCASPRCTAWRPTVACCWPSGPRAPTSSTTCPTMSVTRCSTTTSTPSPTCTWSTPGPSTCPSYRRPVDAPDHARQELDLWGTILETRTTQAVAAGPLHPGRAAPVRPDGRRSDRAVPRRRRARGTSCTTAAG